MCLYPLTGRIALHRRWKRAVIPTRCENTQELLCEERLKTHQLGRMDMVEVSEIISKTERVKEE